MLKGLFIARQYKGMIYKRDFESSDFWETEKYGIEIDVCNNYKYIYKNIKEVISKYDFFITEDIRIQKFRKHALEPIKERSNKKIFFISHEPFKPDTFSMEKRFFFHKMWYNGPGDYFFVPDAVFTPGFLIDSWWKKYTTCNTYLTGYPRFDYYNRNHSKPLKNDIKKMYGLSKNKKIVFFPSFPAYIYLEDNDIRYNPVLLKNKKIKKENGYLIDLYEERELLLKMLENFAIQNFKEYQVVVKIHPMSLKVHKNNNFVNNRRISKISKKYQKKPTDFMITITDEYNNGNISKHLVTVSDIVVGWASTIMLEAMIVKIPVICVLPGVLSDLNFYPDYEKTFSIVKNEKEFLKKIKDEKVCFDQNILEKYFYKNDQNVCKRICDAIKKEMNEPKKQPILIKEMIPKDI